MAASSKLMSCSKGSMPRPECWMPLRTIASAMVGTPMGLKDVIATRRQCAPLPNLLAGRRDGGRCTAVRAESSGGRRNGRIECAIEGACPAGICAMRWQQE